MDTAEGESITEEEERGRIRKQRRQREAKDANRQEFTEKIQIRDKDKESGRNVKRQRSNDTQLLGRHDDIT